MLSNEKMTYILQDERVQDFYIKKILESFSSAHTPIFFKNIIEEWMENTKPLLKASTYIKYRNMLYSYIFPYFEDLTTEELTVECLRIVVQWWKKQAGTVFKNSFRRVITSSQYLPICQYEGNFTSMYRKRNHNQKNFP